MKAFSYLSLQHYILSITKFLVFSKILFIVVFTIVYKRKSAVKFQIDIIKKSCLFEPTRTQMRAKKQKKQAIFLDCLNGCTHGTLGNMGKPYIPPHSPFLFHCVLRGSEVTSPVLFCISAPTTREKRQLLL